MSNKTFYSGIAVMGLFFGWVAVSAYDNYQADKAFVEMCMTMGGEAVIGQYGNLCVKSDAVIN